MAEAEAATLRITRQNQELEANKRREEDRLRKESERKAKMEDIAKKEQDRRRRQVEDREKEARRREKAEMSTATGDGRRQPADQASEGKSVEVSLSKRSLKVLGPKDLGVTSPSESKDLAWIEIGYATVIV